MKFGSERRYPVVFRNPSGGGWGVEGENLYFTTKAEAIGFSRSEGTRHRQQQCVHAFRGVPAEILAELCSDEMQAKAPLDRFLALGVLIAHERARLKRATKECLRPEACAAGVKLAFCPRCQT